jgi:hypothetical protein
MLSYCLMHTSVVITNYVNHYYSFILGVLNASECEVQLMIYLHELENDIFVCN